VKSNAVFDSDVPVRRGAKSHEKSKPEAQTQMVKRKPPEKSGGIFLPLEREIRLFFAHFLSDFCPEIHRSNFGGQILVKFSRQIQAMHDFRGNR
jgi:hypothetical protein